MPFTLSVQHGLPYLLVRIEGPATSVASAANRSGASEKAAQKSGLALRTFLDYDEALDWLSPD